VKKIKREGFLYHELEIDDIGNFWVVTYPTDISELIDICFESNVVNMMYQTKGGLNPEEVVGVFKREREAKDFASELLRDHNKRSSNFGGDTGTDADFSR
jgi:hypothetical protein